MTPLVPWSWPSFAAIAPTHQDNAVKNDAPPRLPEATAGLGFGVGWGGVVYMSEFFLNFDFKILFEVLEIMIWHPIVQQMPPHGSSEDSNQTDLDAF